MGAGNGAICPPGTTSISGLTASTKGTRWDQVLQVLVAYRLIAPGSEWKATIRVKSFARLSCSERFCSASAARALSPACPRLLARCPEAVAVAEYLVIVTPARFAPDRYPVKLDR
jgi:hypothetical protein